MSLFDVEVRQTGNLAAAPELTMVGTGEKRKAKVNLTVLTNERYTNRETGEVRETTTSVRWTLWDHNADNAMKLLRKGTPITILGRMNNNNYEKDGEKVYDYQFTVVEFRINETKAAGEAREARNGGPNDGGGHPDDDIPM